MGPRMMWGKRDALVAGLRRRRHTAENGTVKPTTPGWYYVRTCSVYPLISRAAPALFSLALFVPSYAVAAENEDMASLRRMLGELKAENRKLSERLSALEGTSAPRRTLHPSLLPHRPVLRLRCPLQICPKPQRSGRSTRV